MSQILSSVSSIVLLYVKPVSPCLMIEFRSCFLGGTVCQNGSKVPVTSDLEFRLLSGYVVQCLEMPCALLIDHRLNIGT